MKEIRTILVGVDFSEGSRSALRQAVRLARLHGAALHVGHVIESLVVADLAEALGQPLEDLREHVVRDTRVALVRFLGDLVRPEDCTLLVRVGSPLRELLAVGEEAAADLLVLGAHGAAGTRQSVGTLAARCVRRASCPVLLVQEGWTGPARTVVAGIDFSEISPKVIEEALVLATRDGARAEVVHVFYGPWHRLHYRAPTPQARPDFREAYQRTLQARLESFVAPFAQAADGVPLECRLREHPHDGRGLAAYAAERGADLLVLGTRGRTNLRDLWLGSTAERILAEAGCSVLTVPPEADAAGGPPKASSSG